MDCARPESTVQSSGDIQNVALELRRAGAESVAVAVLGNSAPELRRALSLRLEVYPLEAAADPWRPPLLLAGGVLGTVPGMVVGAGILSGVDVGRCSGDCGDAGFSTGALLGVAIGGPLAGVATVYGVADAGPRHSPFLPVAIASLAPLALIPVAVELDPHGGLWGGVAVLGPPIAATRRPPTPSRWGAVAGRW